MHTLKIYICCLLVIAPFTHAFAQQVELSNQNYTMQVSAQEAFTTEAAFENAPLDKKITNITYYDGLGRPKQSIAVGASPGMAPTINQLQMDWESGAGGTDFFIPNGGASENRRVMGTDPNGTQSLLWECVNDAGNDADGGWNTRYFTIDNTQTYRYAVWVKRTGSQNGYTHHGTKNVNTLDGVEQGNPYFWYGDLPQLDTWYLMVGIIHPHDYTGDDQGISGVYDTHGNRVLDGKEFKWRNTISTTLFRSYLYYSTDTTVRQYFWNPTVQIMDGTQDQINQLTQQELPQRADIIAHSEYDELGRQAKQYMPFTSNGTTGSYRQVDVNKDINQYYLDQYAEDFPGITDPTQVNAYAELVFERSPAGRVLETAAPGTAWKHVEGEIQYENPVYTYFPTTISYDKFWEAQDIFYIEGEHNLPTIYDNGFPLLQNNVRLIIEGGLLTLRIRTTVQNGGTHKLPLGKLRHIPIASEIKNIDLGILKDKNGNNTDYKVSIEDNYFTITATKSNPSPVSQGILAEITYDLTQIQYVAYQNVYRSTPDSHTVKSEFDLNTADEVLRFDVVMTGTNNQTPSLVPNGSYGAEQLTKSITKNENWSPADGKNRTAETFTDKNGRVLLSRGYDNGQALDTYNVYDDYGNLTYVIPPKVDSTDGISQSELVELCYQYKYDNRNRLIESKQPGKGWEYVVYNELDQPVLTQDEILKTQGVWLFTKYDVLGRGTYTGMYTDTRDRKALQDHVNTVTTLWEQRSVVNTIGGTTIYYSNAAFPTTNIELHTISYYDDYGFDIAGLTNPGTAYGEAITDKTRTLPTGSKVRVLGTNDWTTSISYYDKKARPIYAASKNEYLSTVDILETQLDFAGKVIQSKSTHTKGSNAPIVTIDSFTYDHQGRVLTQTQKINDQAEQLITNNEYDKLGQLIAKEVGGGLQHVDYKKNIRGWLTAINNGDTANGDLFGFKIDYNTPQNKLYNGNIGGISWKSANDNVARSYMYSYDALDRITKAISNDGKYDLSGITYDKMGNILSLDRKGHLDANATTFGEMDKLSYTYEATGHKLLSVTDAGNTTFGFKDGNVTGNDYEYDTNGSITADKNKGITNIEYNHFGFPKTITFDNSDSKKIEYVYDATGSKLKKTLTNGGDVTVTEYAGAQYKNGVLEFIPQPEGYIEKSVTSSGVERYQYVYQFTDHLGNVRLSYSDKNNDGVISAEAEIIEENNYYPFGLKHKGYNSTIRGKEHNYKYNNTELEEGLGLNWYEMPLRSYDPTTARWNRIDPVVHHGLSTYNAFDNNPIYYADPSGGNSYRAGHGARMQMLTARYYGSELSNLDSYIATVSDHSGMDNNSNSGTRITVTNYGTNLSAAIASLGLSSCDDCQEGQIRQVPGPQLGVDGPLGSTTQYYHGGGANESDAGWYTENDYYELFRTTIRGIGQGQASIESLGDFGFTDDVLINMVAWAGQAYEYYGGEVPKARGNTDAMGVDSPFFGLGVSRLITRLAKRNTFAFWSGGKATELAAKNAGFKVIGGTRAGGNMINLTANMIYKPGNPGSQAYQFWGRLSAALARTVPKGGKTNVFLTREAANNPLSIWNKFERPILEQNNVIIKYNWVK